MHNNWVKRSGKETWFNCFRHSFDVLSSVMTLTSFIAHMCPPSLLKIANPPSYTQKDMPHVKLVAFDT